MANDSEIVAIKKDVAYLVKKVDSIDEKLEAKYITKLEFDPIKKLVYGTVSVILVGVMTALVRLILIQWNIKY